MVWLVGAFRVDVVCGADLHLKRWRQPANDDTTHITNHPTKGLTVLSPLHTDTAAQQAVATEIGDIATAQKPPSTPSSTRSRRCRPPPGFDRAATQAKAMHLNDAGLALMNEFSNIAERVGWPPRLRQHR
ncbi:hypothetical protein I553_3823 [Mycobacterium xenopi 4042]|uniref:Uncharacterized protein n=1 Tax=Mycobacterium xenopi 4042 TaxID=1299334 RepID=X8A0X6_MYCXE|nr:hypothetical protein I553_3823 [Mycobacterium xenopi 4042]